MKKRAYVLLIILLVTMCMGTGCKSKSTDDTQVITDQEKNKDGNAGYKLVTPDKEEMTTEQDDYYKYSRLEEQINKVTKETAP